MTNEMNMFMIMIIGLASFRLTRLIVYDKITEFLRSPFFDEVKEMDDEGMEEIFLVPKKSGWKKWIGELLSCYWCMGIWSSMFLIFMYFYFPMFGELVILILSVSAIAAIIETIIGRILSH